MTVVIDGARRRLTAWPVALIVLTLIASGCGGGSDDAATSTAADAAKDAKSLASLVIIDRDTSVRPVGTAAYRGGNEGERLGVGDSIQTSATGFAEVAFFDGSLTRVDRSGEFTLTALSDVAGARRVEGSLVGGRAWSRVTKATGSSDQFEIDTPVASATVRGTAFAIDCTVVDVCTFIVVEGIVEVNPIGGTPVLVTAPAQLTVRRNIAPAAPTPLDAVTINNDPWIAKNTTRDTTQGKTPTTTSTTSSTTSTTTTTATTTTTIATTTTARTPATTLAPPPPPTEPPPTAPPTTAALPLDLGGTWNATVDYTIGQATGCFVGVPVVKDGGRVYAACARGAALFFNYATTVEFICTRPGCFANAAGDPSFKELRRTSPTTIAVDLNERDTCLPPPNGADQAQLSADGRVLTFLTVRNRCGYADLVQIVGSWTLTRA